METLTKVKIELIFFGNVKKERSEHFGHFGNLAQSSGIILFKNVLFQYIFTLRILAEEIYI